MFLRSTVLPLLVAALFLTACSTIKVDTGWDPNTDFSQYKTYDFPRDEDIEKEPLKVAVSVAVGERLEAVGFKVDVQDPDLTVVAYGAVADQISFTQRIPWYQPDGGWNGWYAGGWGMGTNVVMRDVPQGSIFVDLVDTEHKRLVWRGTVHKAIVQDPDPGKVLGRVDSVIARMFEGFPPGP